MMYHVMALVQRSPNRLEESCATDYFSMWGPLELGECLDRIGDMNYNSSAHRNYHYFVISEEEYQSYWKGVVS